MTARLSKGPDTSTLARVQQVMHQEKCAGPVPLQVGSRVVMCYKAPFRPFDLNSQPYVDDTGTEYWGDLGPRYQVQMLEDKCKQLYDVAEGMQFHARLDDCLSEWLECSFRWASDEPEDTLVQTAVSILERLPSHPPGIQESEMIELLDELSSCHFVESSSHDMWENSKSAKWVDHNVIRIALQMAAEGYGSRTDSGEASQNSTAIQQMVNHINNVGALLHHAHRLRQQRLDNHQQQAWRWMIVELFLWSTWHRSVLLVSSLNLRLQLRGVPSSDGSWQAINTSFISWLDTSACHDPPEWMCRWSYECIRSDRASLSSDLRSLCSRYQEFAQLQGVECLEARCDKDEYGTPRQCNGRSPFACRRYIGTDAHGETINQSAHAWPCQGTGDGCLRLWWNEESYRRAAPAPAVDVAHDGIDAGLTFTPYSGKTMAISHVWSHGQGGRIDKKRTSGLTADKIVL
ncbi:hypothetical protein AAFC00_005469 [Neodothiora populina]|uniref:Uncharacterized protein n=1 Tax=Neodothiora populina TaxID=2781224 RepID=A0ABR3PL09_9PEZI